MEKNLILQIVVIVLSILPVSLILIKAINYKYDSKLGSAGIICTNISGVFIKNYSIVKSIVFDKYKISIEENKNMLEIENQESKELISIDRNHLRKEKTMELIANITHLCHYPKMSKIEKIITEFLHKCGLKKKDSENKFSIIEKLPSSKEKKLSTIVAKDSETNEVFAFTKGNPQKILEKCTRILVNGKKLELNTQLKRKIRKKIEKLNKKGQKVLAYAYKGLPLKILDKYTEQFTENDLIFLGQIGLANPINYETIETINKIKKLNTKIYILSSMKERNCTAIAKELEVINPHYFESITGSHLKILSDQKLKKMLSNKEKDLVFSEMASKDRIRIMQTLKELGETIAITNKKQTHSLKVLFEEIKRGKTTNANKSKVTQHAISCKIAEFAVAIFAIIIGVPLPLSIALILIIDIFINTGTELAIMEEKGTTKPTKPHNKVKTVLSGIMIGAIITAAYYLNLIRFGWTYGDTISSSDPIFIKSATIVFALLGIIQILNAFIIRKAKKSLFTSNITANMPLILVATIGLAIIYFSTKLEAIHSLLNTSVLSVLEWQIIIFTIVLMIFFREILKVFKNENKTNK